MALIPVGSGTAGAAQRKKAGTEKNPISAIRNKDEFNAYPRVD
jgi:hypothetical protein